MKVIVLLCFVPGLLLAQTQSMDSSIYFREARLVIDNDVFLSIYLDQYYSSGIFGVYRFKTKQQPQKSKSVRFFSLSQRIYTPNSITQRRVANFDRPYAGTLSVSIGQENYWKKIYSKIELEIGQIGPKSKTGDIQETWHGWFGLPTPRGWKYQITNIPIFNVNTLMANTWFQNKHIGFLTETNFSIGTLHNFIRQEIMMKLGKLQVMNKSVQYGGRLSEGTVKLPDNRALEWFVIYSPGFEYVIHNTTIEGGWHDSKSPHTENPKRQIFQHRYGFMASWSRMDWSFIIQRRTPETTEASQHKFATLVLNFRF